LYVTCAFKNGPTCRQNEAMRKAEKCHRCGAKPDALWNDCNHLSLQPRPLGLAITLQVPNEEQQAAEALKHAAARSPDAYLKTLNHLRSQPRRSQGAI
jgi:hypothetical protein